MSPEYLSDVEACGGAAALGCRAKTGTAAAARAAHVLILGGFLPSLPLPLSLSPSLSLSLSLSPSLLRSAA